MLFYTTVFPENKGIPEGGAVESEADIDGNKKV
jgi:hypothetical protein